MAIAAVSGLFGLAFAGSPATLAPGVRIAGVDVGGLLAADARKLLERRSRALADVPVVFTAAGHTWRLRPRPMGIDVDWRAAVGSAAREGGGLGPLRGFRRIEMRVFGADEVLVAGGRATGPAGAGILTGGLLVAVGLYVLGLLLLPGAAPGLTGRLRRVLDGLGVGVSFLFTVWLLLPAQRAGGLSAAIALLLCTGLSIAVVTGVRAIRYRRAALACCGGAVLSTLGLAGMALSFLGGGRPVGLQVGADGALFLSTDDAIFRISYRAP